MNTWIREAHAHLDLEHYTERGIGERGAGDEPEPSDEVAVVLAIAGSVMEAAHGQRRVE